MPLYQSYGVEADTMSTDNTITAFDDVLSEREQGKADYGVSARRKAQLSSYDAPLHVLAANGIEVPHRDFNPEDAQEYPTTQELPDVEDSQGESSARNDSSEKNREGSRVHLHQDVREQSEDVFGDFGSAEEDTDDIVWTVVDLTDGSVTITVVGDWTKRRDVPVEEFADEYEPLTADTERYVPVFGY